MYSVDFSLTNGLGKPSVSIYYSGCDIPVKCKECHNPELWRNSPSQLNYEELHRLIKGYADFGYSDELIISFLGGDPLAPFNRDSVMKVSEKVKQDFPEAKLIMYSWRLPQEIEDEWIENFDFGVLGEFDIGEYREGYLPASTNQIIYDFKNKKTMKPVNYPPLKL